MTASQLQICRDVLENAYREKLGITFCSSIAEIETGRQPVWRTVSDDDLTSELRTIADGAAGLLLDPEIGLLSYILPFNAEKDLRAQIKRALALRSQLSIERNYVGPITDASDSRGSWRVLLHWLAEAALEDEWTDQIMAVRRETAFSEEISFDAIFLIAGDVKAQIEEYSFPRLLLSTREVLKKESFDAMTHWLSANRLVKEALADFATGFHKPEQREFANEVVRTMQDFQGPGHTTGPLDQPPEKPQTIRSIQIRNFRNLSDVGFDFGVQPVSVSIVHGPNGTGKSSLCEAISIALFHSSFRYKSFANRNKEKDVVAMDRAAEYIAKYLTPLEDEKAKPAIALDAQQFAKLRLIGGDQTEEADLAMCGTILTQDTTLEFVRMSSDELGAHVLRGYSELADHIEEITDGRVNQANAVRQEFLRRLGLSAAITKVETAYERIVRREIDQSLPALPQRLVAWLQIAAKVTGDAGSGLAQRWRAWGDDENRNKLARQVAASSNNRAILMRDICDWLYRFNELALGSSELVKNAESRVGSFRSELENAAERIAAWGEWLERRKQAPASTASPQVGTLTQKLNDLQKQQKQVIERGRSAGGHFDHLTQVEAYVRETWSKQHPDDCPTCGTNHAEHGGIVSVVEALRAKIAQERDWLRQEYSSLKLQIDQVQKQLADLGQGLCPLTAGEQSSLIEALQWLVPETAPFSEWIGVKEQRDSLLAALITLRQTPSVPTSVNAESESERVVNRLLSQFQEADKTLDAPANWKPVRDMLTKTLATIVNEHLPNTLAKLWLELALNLTSAPWLMPERPKFQVSTRRSEPRATVGVKDRLARYILNQAEVHTLGLAWFFTRYLTRGRFFHACMVMDDPAHELDQTSFRDLCRLLETLVRLHRVYNRPLKLIVMLNQESRALEAARATGGILAVLGWARDQEKALKAISVVGEGFYAPQPGCLFGRTGT